VQVIRGAYGQGKSFSLRLLEEAALATGFLVARTEIDACENQLNKPHKVYQELMRNLRVPERPEGGAAAIACLMASHHVARREQDISASQMRRWLEQQIDCKPLSWLLSDSGLPKKEALLGLLAGDPNVRVQDARRVHILPGLAQDWPNFTAGTQGDFACYLLSGLGKFARLSGFQGLVVILDEMEKWQDLNWRAQCQAGNLIGGLIWAATASAGNRHRHSYWRPNERYPERLTHSLRSGGYPFTTEPPCHLGLVIAMTPRFNDEGPEELWREFGPLEILDLRSFRPADVRAYVERAVQLYQQAYDIPPPDVTELGKRAVAAWAEAGDGSTRSAVKSVVQVLDDWRAAHDR
jgi:hypothetical protein